MYVMYNLQAKVVVAEQPWLPSYETVPPSLPEAITKTRHDAPEPVMPARPGIAAHFDGHRVQRDDPRRRSGIARRGVAATPDADTAQRPNGTLPRKVLGFPGENPGADSENLTLGAFRVPCPRSSAPRPLRGWIQRPDRGAFMRFEWRCGALILVVVATFEWAGRGSNPRPLD